MPPKNFRSVAVPDETYDGLQVLASVWSRQLGISLSAGKTITRLVNLEMERVKKQRKKDTRLA